MATEIIPKKSVVADKVPLVGDLSIGELAVNLTDKKIYSKNGAGVIVSLTQSVDTSTVTDAGALMDSELTSIVDVKALNQSLISGASPTLGIGSMTIDDTNLVVSDTTNLQTFAEGVDKALLAARGTGFTSTYVSTVTVGGTTFAQPAVNGEIHSDQGYFAIAYAGATDITVATLNSSSTYVYIDNAGNLQQQTSIPTRQDWSRKIFTMRISVDTVAGTILGFEYLGNPIGHYSNSMRDFFRALLEQGVPFKGGQTITGRASDLGFDVAAGTIMEFGGTGDINNPNLLTLDAAANVSYSLLSQTAIVGDQTNLVKSWDNAGAITTLGSGTFVAHRLYRFSNGTFAIQYGQGNYANIVLARAGLLIEDYVLNERLKNATFFGWWILGETATNTGGTTLTEFREYTIGVQGGSSSVLSGCLLKGNNLSDLLDVPAAQVYLDLEPGVDVQSFSTVLANTTASFTTGDETKLNNIETSATADQTAGEIETIVSHDNLLGFIANEHIDWTTDQGATNVHSGNYTDTNTTYSVGDAGLTEINFTTADNTKLDGIEALADVTDTLNVTAAGALMDSEVDADIKTFALPANTTISSFGASLVDDISSSVARTTLGLAIGTNVQAYDSNLPTWPSTVNATEVGYLNGATGAIQTQLNTKADAVTGGTGITLSGNALDLSFNIVVTSIVAGSGMSLGTSISYVDGMNLRTETINHSDTSAQASINNTGLTYIQDVTLDTFGHITALGSGTISLSSFGITATPTQINYTAGVTGAIQTQLDAKAGLASPPFTGAPTVPTAVGGTNTTQAASTEFVNTALSGVGSAGFVVKTTAYTASTGDNILANTSGGVWTLTLPATPTAGDTVTIADYGDNWNANNLTVARNGATIEGLAENLVMDIEGLKVSLVYSGATWQVFTQTGAGADLNNVGYRNIPLNGEKTAGYTLLTGDVGKCVTLGTGGGVTVPNSTFTGGDVISVYNNTGSDATITLSTATSYKAGASTNEATLTLAQRGVATILFINATTCVVSGSV
jgi:hypothetical protein